MKDVHLFQHRNTQLELSATTPLLHSNDITKNLFFSTLRATLTGKNQHDTKISSKQGSYNLQKSQLSLKDSVILKNADFIGKTDALDYFQEKKLAKTDSDVLLQNENITITGTGMTYYLDSGSLMLGEKGRVICDINKNLKP